MKIQNIVPLLIACGFVSQSYSADQVKTDATRTSGAGAIAPSFAATYLASGSTAEATMEGLTGFAAIHDFAFTGNQALGDNYIFNFTDDSVADMQLSYTGVPSGSAVIIGDNPDFLTSSGSSFRLQGSGTTNPLGLTIQLGSYNTGTSTFSNFTSAGQGVAALGFTITGPRFDDITAAGVTITYLDASGGTLSTQNLAQTISGTGTKRGYTGYQSAGAPIASVTISLTGGGDLGGALFGVDDIGMTSAIPEPSSFALLAGCLALGATMIRRRRA